jgi:hypothetical protein
MIIKFIVLMLLIKYININQLVKKKINIFQFVFKLYGKKD